MNNLITHMYRLKKYFYLRGCIRTARLIAIPAHALDIIDIYGFKHLVLETVWNFLRWLDDGESFDYETAPYCGHHHCGFENKYLATHYHEGDGGGNTKFRIFGYKLYYDNIDGNRYYITNKQN